MTYKEALSILKTTLQIAVYSYNLSSERGLDTFGSGEIEKARNDGSIKLAETVIEMIDELERKIADSESEDE